MLHYYQNYNNTRVGKTKDKLEVDETFTKYSGA